MIPLPEQNKIWITGCSGQLGKILSEKLPFSHKTDKDTIDISNYEDVYNYCFRHPEIETVINCSALTDLGFCEKAGNQNYVFKTNTESVRTLDSLGKNVIHISTNYVFDGKSMTPYSELDKPNPLNVYGLSKKLSEDILLKSLTNSEKNHIIIRTSLLYSSDFTENSKNFLKICMERLRANETINAVNDQYQMPTNSEFLANAILTIYENLSRELSGIYNFSDSGDICSPYDIIQFLKTKTCSKSEIIPISITQLNKTSNINRPRYSVLNNSKIEDIFGISPIDWKDSLSNIIEHLK